MSNPEIKFLFGGSKGKWSKLTVDNVEYVIKFDVTEKNDTLQSITCSLSDYQKTWVETITCDEFFDRLKRCNPLLACKELMARIICTVTGIQRNENAQITELNDGAFRHLNTKHYLSDGSDPVPLKFYWSLEEGATKSIHEIFNEMLMKISDLERTNVFLLETILKKEQELNNLPIATIKQNLSPSGANNCSLNTDSSIEMLGVCHEGVTCHNCGKSICGNWYKCMECENFNLCMTCEHIEKQHADHIMVRYAQPNDKVRSQELFRAYTKKTTQQKAKQQTPKRTRLSKQ